MNNLHWRTFPCDIFLKYVKCISENYARPSVSTPATLKAPVKSKKINKNSNKKTRENKLGTHKIKFRFIVAQQFHTYIKQATIDSNLKDKQEKKPLFFSLAISYKPTTYGTTDVHTQSTGMLWIKLSIFFIFYFLQF